MSRRDLHQAVALAGQTFRPITSADLPLIVHAVERTRAMLWAAYGPFLLSYGQSPARAVLIGGLDDALVVLLRRTVKGQDHLDLVIPPLCDRPVEVFDALVPAITSFNGNELETRLLWADLPAVSWLSRRQSNADEKTGSWLFSPYEREYLYRRDLVLAMNGAPFRHLRKRLKRCEREAMPSVRPFHPADRDACTALLGEWQDAREHLVAPVFDFAYTKAALDLAPSISPPLMEGVVVEVEGRARAFAFGGLLRPGVGQFFLLKSDPAVHGLAETARVALLERLEGCDLVNDAGDLGRQGLRQHKEMLRPVGFVPTWKGAYRPSVRTSA